MFTRRKFIMATLVLILILGIFVLQQIVQMPKSKAEEAILENELSQIQQLSGMRKLDHYSFAKPGRVLVGTTFKADLGFEIISQYYKDELPKYGWTYQGSKNTTVGGKDLGGKEVTFSKGQYVLTLDSPGNDPSFNYTFAMDLSWR